MLHNHLFTREHGVTLDRREAAFRPQSFDATALTVEATIATATPVQRRDQRGPYVEVLDITGADLAALRGASVLDSHSQEGVASVIGTVDEARIEGGAIVARLRFSTRPEVAAIVSDIRSGILNSLSVGYEVSEWRDGADASGTRTRTAVRWTPREVSFVAVPADPLARTRGLPTQRGVINRQIRELASRVGVAASVVDDLIDREAGIDEAREVVLSELMTRGRTPIRTAMHRNEFTLDNPETFVRAAGEALSIRANPAMQPSAAARQFIGLSIPDMARECLRRAGAPLHGIGAAEVVTRALHTTSDFPQILADTVGRTLRDAYTAAPSGIRQLARQQTAPDFRKRSRLMLDALGIRLEKVGEAGEFKRGTMVEAGESYKLDTFGRIFGITRQALINDDLGAFTDVSRRLGQAAAIFEVQSLVDLLVSNAGLGPTLSDTKALFHADHGNLAGAGAIPSETTLNAARLAMRHQTGPGGELIAVTPWALVVPAELETSCEKLLTQVQAIQTNDVNVFSRLRLIVEPRLEDAYRWYLVADPTTIDGLEFAYLAGQPGPQTESRAGFDVDGVEVKIRLDFGCGFVDHRGWYANAGH